MKTYKDFIERSNNIIVTLPSNVSFEDYKKELKEVIDGDKVLNFKVSTFPKNTKVGDRCYLIYSGNIIGWMTIVGFDEKEFNCDTTGKLWKGKFIQRSGKFNEIEPIPYKGFQGFRYIEKSIENKIKNI